MILAVVSAGSRPSGRGPLARTVVPDGSGSAVRRWSRWSPRPGGPGRRSRDPRPTRPSPPRRPL